MGVLNVSKDSPYDPSVFHEPDEAAAYVDEELIGEGADVVDVGLESANKRFDVLSAEQELDRLDTALETIESVSGDAVFSIETRYAEVAEAALDGGFDMVNDICGFADPAMPEICTEYDVAVVKMASPPDLERPGAVDDVDWSERRSPEWAEGSTYVDRIYEALTRNGFTEKTIVDPAFGGWSERKTVAHDRETFRRLREFRSLGHPILVSINRKNFLRTVADRSTEAALPVSLAATSLAVERGADLVRTHDVAETLDAALIGHEFGSGRRDEPQGAARRGEPTVERLDVWTSREARRHLEAAGGDPEQDRACVSRCLAVDAIDADQRECLTTAATKAGVVCTGSSRLVLGGTLQSLHRLVETLSESGSELLAGSLREIIE
jgi:dihydropteroate synthase